MQGESQPPACGVYLYSMIQSLDREIGVVVILASVGIAAAAAVEPAVGD